LGGGGASRRGGFLLNSEKGSGKVWETLFRDNIFRASNHSVPSKVNFLIKTVMGGEEGRGLPNTHDLELSGSKVEVLVVNVSWKLAQEI
jgi:hypothetical protein